MGLKIYYEMKSHNFDKVKKNSYGLKSWYWDKRLWWNRMDKNTVKIMVLKDTVMTLQRTCTCTAFIYLFLFVLMTIRNMITKTICLNPRSLGIKRCLAYTLYVVYFKKCSLQQTVGSCNWTWTQFELFRWVEMMCDLLCPVLFLVLCLTAV